MIEDLEQELTANPGNGSTSGGQGQAFTATGYGSRPYDLGPIVAGAIPNDLAIGQPLQFLYKFTENYNNMTSLVIDVLNDTDGAGGSAVVLATSGTILLANATIAAGVKRLGAYALPQVINKRYITARVTITGTAPTLGKIAVWFQKGTDVVPVNAGAM